MDESIYWNIGQQQRIEGLFDTFNLQIEDAEILAFNRIRIPKICGLTVSVPVGTEAAHFGQKPLEVRGLWIFRPHSRLLNLESKFFGTGSESVW